MTGTPGKCVARSSIDISSSLLPDTRVRACARIERAAATSHGGTRGNSSRNRDEKPFQADATEVIVQYNSFVETVIYFFTRTR